MKRNRIEYSQKYYSRVRKTSFLIIILCGFLLFFLFSSFAYNQSLNNEKDVMNAENSKSQLQISETIKTYETLCMSLANYSSVSPLFQAENENLQLKILTFQNEIDTLFAAHEYIQGIFVEMADYSVSTSTINDDLTFINLIDYGDYTVSYSEPQEYPHLLKIEYTNEYKEPYRVSIYLKSYSIGKTFLNDNSFVTDAYGNIIISGNESMYDNISKYHDVPKSHSYAQNSVTGKYIIDSKSLLDGNCYTVNLKPSNEIFNSIILNLAIYLLISAIFISIAIYIVNIILRNLYIPINNVVQTFKYILPSAEEEAKSDIQNITQYINKSLNNKQDSKLDERTKNAMVQIKKSQFYTLHSQISPHFLGNALSVIQHQANRHLGFENKISESIAIFGKMLYRTARYNRMIIPISEEISQTEEYIKVAKYCFLEDLTVNWELAEELTDYAIISHTIQPLIENSIVHAFSDKSENPMINIVIAEENGDVLISVYDNGIGIESNTLKILKEAIFESSNELEKSHHVGIQNVHLKNRLLFGEKYGIKEIKSDETGTCISVLMPKYEITYEN